MTSSLRRKPARLAAVLAAVAALIALAASGASGRTGSRPHPAATWATINVCDSAQPHLGIRGHMAGDGSHEQMYMRFTAQFRAAHGWKRLSGSGRSPWVRAGTAFTRYQEIGWTFGLSRPAAGTAYLLRGFVEFEWRARRHGHDVVVRRTSATTHAGHRGTKGAEPRNFSAATCRIAG